MTWQGWGQIGAFLLITLAVTPLVGHYLVAVFGTERTRMDRVFGPVERLVYRVARVDEARGMAWPEYAASLLVFSAVSLLATYALMRAQPWLPLNPQGLPDVPPDLAFNTAVSFTTNTNWQSYVPETTVSYLTQMAGLAYHNFMSAAVGLVVAVAVIRGLAAREDATLGNFWVDMTRAWTRVLLPACLVGALGLVALGVPQNLRPYDRVRLVDPPAGGGTVQNIAQGPVASQEIIKELGTNGGGFFNANSAHPFENPTPVTNFLQIVLIFAIPTGLTWTLGSMTGSRRHGWAVWSAMAVLFLAGVAVTYWAEAAGNPLLASGRQASLAVPGGNMEGKEVRFGTAGSALFATVTTGASCGAVNAMHDSFTPLGGMIPLVNIMLGEIVFGGVGAGLYGMIIFVVLAVFIAGLMVGRTPEYLGKKIEAFDVQMAMIAVLVVPLAILGFTGVSVVASRFGLSSLLNHGPHGLSEILYAFTSGAGNNGSAFAGLSANTPWYNVSLGVSMLVGRFAVIVPVLALAGHLGAKKRVPPSAGTFPVTTPLFAVLLVSVILIVGALTYFPALSLGPILEHLQMTACVTF
jgi:K+-transporting ATPase ATPase A chain